MKQDIRLYIAGKEVEFTKDPQILFNYKIDDVTKPTAIKNSYSKGLVLEGTPTNNDIFGNIWNLERMQAYGYEGGVGFNAIKKAPFEIYVNGERYESGYVKLDTITEKNNSVQYNLTLYGGLGELFFNLSFVDGEGDAKKTLADLRYGWDGLYEWENTNFQEKDLDFTINKETVFDAWKTLTGDPDAVYDEDEVDRPNNYLYDDKWEIINFMPAYEGKPSDFGTSKVLINRNEMVDDTIVFDVDGFTTVNGFALGEMEDEELTQNMTKDFRSYLQRPVIRLKSIIDACCDPQNNGGWKLILDEHFFEGNPYYENTWLTLPMLRDNIEGGKTFTQTEATLSEDPRYNRNIQFYDITTDLDDTITEYTNVKLGIGLEFRVDSEPTYDQLYLGYRFTGNVSGIGYRTKKYWADDGLLVQLVAYNATGSVCGVSNVNLLHSGGYAGYSPSMDTYRGGWLYNNNIPYNNVVYRNGCFVKDGSSWLWSENGDTPTALMFSLNTSASFSHLELKTARIGTFTEEYRGSNRNRMSKSVSVSVSRFMTGNGWQVPKVEYNGNLTITEAMQQGKRIDGTYEWFVQSAEFTVNDVDTLFSNTRITKEEMLNTEFTPCDYLTGFAKMFGLYFYRDPSEVADDPTLFPKGVIRLMDRDTYYKQDEIVDLSLLIDKGKDMKITPQIPASKWIQYKVEQVESDAAEDYENVYGSVYGTKRVNTGYNFDAKTKDLLENIPYRGGIEVLEVDKYFNLREGFAEVPTYMLNGFSYTLYKTVDGDLEDNTIEVPVRKVFKQSLNPNGWENADAFSKVQIHKADNEPSEGENMLVFYKGSSWRVEDEWNYYLLTDDLLEMNTLNDGEPCYIYSYSEDSIPTYNYNGQTKQIKVCYKLSSLPMFGRNILGLNNSIVHSLDMGAPQITYVRDTFITNGMSIYDKCWRDFINDMYDVNTRKLTCYVRFTERPNSDMLRRFYWFNNSIWRINAIKDWNISSYDPVNVEFVKVQDIENYKMDSITMTADFEFYLQGLKETEVEKTEYGNTYRWYEIGPEAQNLTAIISNQNADSWSFTDSLSIRYEDNTYDYVEAYEGYMEPASVSGTGDAVKTLIIPQNEAEQYREYAFSLYDGDDNLHTIYIKQAAQAAELPKSITITPSTITGPSEGGVVTAQVYYQNRGTDTISYDYNEGEEYNYFTFSMSAWNGDYATLTIGFDENTSTEPKTGAYLKLESLQDGDVSASVLINQEGKEEEVDYNYELSTYNINAGSEASSFTVNFLNSNMASFNIREDADWITVSTPTTTGFDVAVSSNPLTTSRSATIIVEGIGGDGLKNTKSISVTQEGYSNTSTEYGFELSTTSLKYQYNGGANRIVLTNANIESYTTATSGVWLTVEQVEDYSFVVRAATTTSAFNRTGWVDVTATYGDNTTETKRITVTQYCLVGVVNILSGQELVISSPDAGDYSNSALLEMSNIKSWYYSVDNSDFSIQVENDGLSFFAFADVANTTGATKTATVRGTYIDTNGNTIYKTFTITQYA